MNHAVTGEFHHPILDRLKETPSVARSRPALLNHFFVSLASRRDAMGSKQKWRRGRKGISHFVA
ncbi:hypothetical protein EV129_12337 [Rhizobium azibense]|uniref:Uncharacterized protein n=1 Tax=Rhizobium azibense TaxID=1136135 RepID=A0A4R3R9C9_9HYPH|nr:hypothetical protein EV129_12337 [Rhizobium azibense]